MPSKPPRIAVRAIIVEDDRLLLVNAWAKGSDLLCAPGGGVVPHAALPDNLKREVYEETGLRIDVGDVALVNEFHDEPSGFHQIEIFFHASVTSGEIDPDWRDPEGVVTNRRWVTREDLAGLRVKPSSLARAAFGGGLTYDPLEPIQT